MVTNHDRKSCGSCRKRFQKLLRRLATLKFFIRVMSGFHREKYLRTRIFWVIAQRVVVISYSRFGTIYRYHPQGSRIQWRITQKSAVLNERRSLSAPRYGKGTNQTTPRRRVLVTILLVSLIFNSESSLPLLKYSLLHSSYRYKQDAN